MIDGLYQLLAGRARGSCEACGTRIPPGELDHFFGRAKAEENETTCWFLCPPCHYAKTRNSPDGAFWYRKFIEHCRRREAHVLDPRPLNGAPYIDHPALEMLWRETRRRAEARLYFIETRTTLGTALGTRR